MQRLLKMIGAVIIVVLTLAAVAETSAQTSNLPDKNVCLVAFNRERSAWEKNPTYSDYVTEAIRRGLTVDACRQLIAQSSSTPTTQSSAQTSNAAKQRLQMLYGMEEGAAAYEQIKKAADDTHTPIDSVVDHVITLKGIMDRDRAVENRAHQGPAIYRYFGPGFAQPITGLTLPECLAQAKGNAGIGSK